MKFVVLAENRKKGICDNEDGLAIYFDVNGNKFLFVYKKCKIIKYRFE